MIFVHYAKEKTNVKRPEPWHYATWKTPNGFMAGFKGATSNHLAVVEMKVKPKWDRGCGIPSPDGYRCPAFARDDEGSHMWDASGGIVPCDKSRDERILLVTLRTGYDCAFKRIEPYGADLLKLWVSSEAHLEMAHAVVRLRQPEGKLVVVDDLGNQEEFGASRYVERSKVKVPQSWGLNHRQSWQK